MSCLFYIESYTSKRGRIRRYVQRFVAGKTFAVNTNSNPYFGGFVIDKPDRRSLEELKCQEWVDGLKISDGGCDIITVRGSDLIGSETEAYERVKRHDEHGAITKPYDRLKIEHQKKCCFIL